MRLIEAVAGKEEAGEGAESLLMARISMLLATLIALLAPFAAAQENETEADPPDQIDVDMDVTDDRGGGAEESTLAGLSTTVVIILIVLAVLVVALIVAMASRP